MLSEEQFALIVETISIEFKKRYHRDLFGSDEIDDLKIILCAGLCAKITIPSHGSCFVQYALNEAEQRIWFVQNGQEQFDFNDQINRKVARILFPRPSHQTMSSHVST